MERFRRNIHFDPPTPRLQLDYRLAVLTNGRPCLRETLEAFRLFVTPPPVDVLVYDDGLSSKPYGGGTEWANIPYLTIGEPVPVGFCAAVPRLWRAAAGAGPPLVFWLEDDQLIRRPVDLVPLAGVLSRERRLAQMGFMRGPANDVEALAGGVRAARPEDYAERDGLWLESRTNFSTGCSLLVRHFMREEPWPEEYDSECEGRYSLDLLARGYTFGVWGLGEPWVDHIGVRSGFGY